MTLSLRLLRASVPVLFLATASCGSGVTPEPSPSASSRSAVTVCGQTSVNGVDVSHYDGTIDWATAKASGIAFGFAKATESTGFVDPQFSANWSGMKAAGVVRGAYHFFHADVDPMAQASFVLQTVGTLEAGDLPITLDLETTNGQSESTIIANATAFLQAVTTATGKTAILYVSPAFLSDFSSFASFSLWIANWNVSCPDVPSPWSTWTFWQSSATGTVPGIPASQVDLDTFNGTLQQLGGGGGTDAGTTMDSGTPPPDAGTSVDSGGNTRDSGTAPPDAGGTTPPPDSGGLGQIQPGVDSGGGSGDGGAGIGSPDTAYGQSSGCAMSPAASAPAPFAALFLGIGIALSRRRRPRN